MPAYLGFVITAAVLIVPFLVGSYLARRFRMPDHGWKIGTVLFAIAAGTVVTVLGWPPKLGIDLSGGVILVYQVKAEEIAAGKTIETEKLIAAVSRRVNPGGVREVTIRPYGTNQIEIIIPEADSEEVNRIERKISSIGELKFRILANNRDHEDRIALARASNAREIRSGSGPDSELLAFWVPIESTEEDYFRADRDICTRPSPSNADQLEVLVIEDPFDVNGEYLTRSSAGVDEQGRPNVEFAFNSRGAQLFGQLTGSNLPDRASGFTRKLGIILDNYLQSAPSINSAIFDRGQITGSFTRERVDEIVSVLNAGSLPNALEEEPVSRLLTGPTLGEDTIRKGQLAITVSMVLVMLFMLVYYRFAGIVACVALIMNLVLTLACMITIKAAFTLPGLAGLVLTVGMAVDANVLIYERIREELQRGATLRMAINNGFARAFTAIFDSNLTTLITAVVLYAIGTDQIKGFAVTLFLGIALSMFTAIFVARVIFEVAERMRWITKLSMMQMIQATNFDFVRMTPIWIGTSLLVIAVGMAGVVMRGHGLLDIDFTGGASVQLLFREDRPQKIADVRRVVEATLPDVAVSDVQISGEAPGVRFLVNTSERDLDKVEGDLVKAYGNDLVYNRMTIESIEPIAAEPAASGPAAPGAPAAGPALPEQSRRDPLPAENELAFADEQTPPEGEGAEAVEVEVTAESPAVQAESAPEAAEVPASEPSGSEPEGASEASAEATDSAEAPGAPTTAPGPTETPPAADPFAGGTRAVLKFAQPIDHDSLEERLKSVLSSVNFDITSDEYTPGSSAAYDQWTVRFAAPSEEVQPGLDALAEQLSREVYFPASSVIGGAVASSTQQQAIYAITASILLMIVYLWVRFQKMAFGVAAAVALIHDVLITLGAVALSYYLAPYLGFALVDPFKINLPIIAAFLTIVGYSVNDTIVTFDRLREVRGKSPRLTPEMVNASVNQTLARTMLTSLTVLLVVVTLYVFGGQGIHGFAFALLIGCIAGVYSTVFIAAPIVLWMLGSDEVGHSSPAATPSTSTGGRSPKSSMA